MSSTSAQSEASQLNRYPTQTFVRSLLEFAPDASLIVGGDMNEYLAARAVLHPLSTVLHDANEVAGVPLQERYTYVYDQHAQEIDHVLVSNAIADREGGVEVEHVHVNTWAESYGGRASDHDPTVVRLWVCDPESGESCIVSVRFCKLPLTQAHHVDATEELGADHGQIVL